MTTAQKIALTIGILGYVATGGTQLTDILAPFGSMAPVIVKELVALAGFTSGTLGIVLTFMTGQAGQIKAVEDMPGVEKLIFNKKANQTAAAIAVSDDHPKVEAVPGAEAALAQIAKG